MSKYHVIVRLQGYYENSEGLTLPCPAPDVPKSRSFDTKEEAIEWANTAVVEYAPPIGAYATKPVTPTASVWAIDKEGRIKSEKALYRVRGEFDGVTEYFSGTTNVYGYRLTRKAKAVTE